MTARIERAPIPEPARLRRVLQERADGLYPGSSVADADIQGPTGVDMLLVDDEGRPVFVDIIQGDAGDVPTRVFEHMSWYERNRRLFLKAYAEAGVVRTEDPVFLFAAPRFPVSVNAAVAAMPGLAIKLMRVQFFLIDGAAEVLLEDVTPSVPEHVGTSVTRRTDEMSTGQTGERDVIESEAVRALLALFRSGVDGLDGRIATAESGERLLFQTGEKKLAEVVLSPGSFTVTPGDGLTNPIVVSDRVSLERALNSVVSLFVREDRHADGGNGSGAGVELTEDERAALSEIWGAGVRQGEGS